MFWSLDFFQAMNSLYSCVLETEKPLSFWKYADCFANEVELFWTVLLLVLIEFQHNKYLYST